KVSSKDGRNFVLLESFTFVTKAGETITVPAGSESDGASTPKPIWNVLPPFGTYWPAAYLHDYLYRYTQRPKSECDSLLNEAMESLGVIEDERIAIYEGVNFGGQLAFDHDRSQQQKV
ncbi:MAG TPA: DUF1353 domain-containing protein, partial [Verrucomicrobiae bacterium]|nr:DUF1353 domain-containing protein [Verrucomicrobiae bacterium]